MSSVMRLEIRDATPADADAIAGVEVASKEASFPELIDEDDLVQSRWAERWRRYLADGSRAQESLGDGFALVAEIGGRPVAFAAYHHTRRHGCDAELQSIYVLKDAQGRGVGTALLRLVASRLRADGSRAMCVGFDFRNPYRRFYLKHGAVEINPHWAVWWDVGSLARPPAL